MIRGGVGSAVGRIDDGEGLVGVSDGRQMFVGVCAGTAEQQVCSTGKQQCCQSRLGRSAMID